MPDPVSKEHLAYDLQGVIPGETEMLVDRYRQERRLIHGLYNAMSVFLPINFDYAFPRERSGADGDPDGSRWYQFTLQPLRYQRMLEMTYNLRYAQLQVLRSIDMDLESGLIEQCSTVEREFIAYRKGPKIEPVLFNRLAEKDVLEHTRENGLTLLEWDLLVMMLFGYIPSEEELGRERLRALATVDVIYNLWRYIRFTKDVFRVRIQPQNDAQLETIMSMNLVILQKLSTLEDPSQTIKTAIAQRRKSLFNEERTLRRRATRRRVFIDAKDVSDIATEVM